MKSRLVCLVNNYNYARYLGMCLDSAIGQTRKFDEIIVVDDGSTDESHEVIDSHSNPSLRTLLKKNEGQLSCFNAALPYIKDDDLVFFLDADDIYPANYVEEALKAISSVTADCYFMRDIRFTDGNGQPTDCTISEAPAIVLPLTRSFILLTRRWIGSPTSGIVFTGKLFRQILPYPNESDWITRADSVIVYAASIMGARMAAIRSLGFGYRMHGNNLFTGRVLSKEEKSSYEAGVNRLFDFYCELAGISRAVSFRELFKEAALLSDEAKAFIKFSGKRKLLHRLIRHYLRLVNGKLSKQHASLN